MFAGNISTPAIIRPNRSDVPAGSEMRSSGDSNRWMSRVSEQPPKCSVDSRPKWAVGYLVGRARAFRSGNVPWRAVEGAARLAVRHGVPPGAINLHLEEWGLRWDVHSGLREVNSTIFRQIDNT